MCETRNSSLLGKITVLVVICCCCLPAQGKYGGGTGEPNDPYLIYDANQMNAIGANAADWDKCFKLMADIDLGVGPPPPPPPPLMAGIDLSGYTGTEFNIIGLNSQLSFSGVFDGNGKIISNFIYTSTETNYIGLFGYVRGGNAKIKNLGLIAPDVDGGTGGCVGSLVGWIEHGTITNCYVESGSVAGNWYVGGLMGANSSATITNCYVEAGSVSGTGCVGGLVGGIGDGTISNCYSSADVSGDEYIGGLVGTNGWEGCWGGTISNCYSTGSVSGTGWATGGLVGYDYSGVYTSSFWDNTVNPWLTGIGNTADPDVIGESTANMQTESTFTDAGWDFHNIWWIFEGLDYPRLQWKETYGGGSGTAEVPYLIYTAEELNTIGLVPFHLDRHFKLMADIDLAGFTGTSFNIIGAGYYSFTGVFDGNGHAISNFTYTSTATDYIGLFAYVSGENTEIKDLGLIEPNVDAGTGGVVGSLVGRLAYGGSITNCYIEGGSVSGENNVGGLVGGNLYGRIGNSYSASSVSGDGYYVGGLAGANDGTITNCYSTGSVSSYGSAGGLVGGNGGTITNCYSQAHVSGTRDVGGLVGYNWGTITNCYSSGSVAGDYYYVGGLVGFNGGTITNCYATGSVSGTGWAVGGLVGYNFYGTITNCYSTGSVSGTANVGGLVGYITYGTVFSSFWDIETSGQESSAGGTGKATAEMQTESTFTDAGWDFNTPVWTIDEGVDYPRLWWEFVPVLHAEPEVSLGTSNTISWETIPGDVEYYAECAEDANFTSIIYNTGWITETSCEFTSLELGQRYWYSVKARNSAGIKTNRSNVESSLQGTLADVVDAVETMLDPSSLKNENMKNALLNKIDAALKMIEEANYTGALSKLEHDILAKMNGCGETGEPDKNDWIITCEEQSEQYRLVIETIEYVKGLVGL